MSNCHFVGIRELTPLPLNNCVKLLRVHKIVVYFKTKNAVKQFLLIHFICVALLIFVVLSVFLFFWQVFTERNAAERKGTFKECYLRMISCLKTCTCQALIKILLKQSENYFTLMNCAIPYRGGSEYPKSRSDSFR